MARRFSWRQRFQLRKFFCAWSDQEVRHQQQRITDSVIIVALLTILESAVYYRRHSSFVFVPCLCQRRCPVRVQLALHGGSSPCPPHWCTVQSSLLAPPGRGLTACLFLPAGILLQALVFCVIIRVGESLIGTPTMSLLLREQSLTA